MPENKQHGGASTTGRGSASSGTHGHSRHSGSHGGRQHSRHHHRHHSGLKHKFKRWWKKHRWVGLACLVAVLLLLVAGVWLLNNKRNQDTLSVEVGRQVDVGSGYRDITYQGKRYRYNNRVTTILYAGVDSDTPLVKLGRYVGAPRADSISLVVMDELNKKTTIIALNRDTMTDIGVYTFNGHYRGMFQDHLGLAYTYGDGEKVSCENLCQAVSNLMFGIPVNEYVVSNRASLPLLGNAIGPVEVVVPNDDLADYGFEAGQTASIDSNNLERFVRTRDIAVDLSNVGRMERQQVYIEGAIGKITQLLIDEPASVWNTIEQAEDCVLTNITRSRYLDLIKVVKNTGYSLGNYYIPDGEQVVGSKHDEFYPDLDALQQRVIELFYIEQ